MCGITGFFRPSGGDETWEHILKNMTQAIQHRGPDDEGLWVHPAQGIALGHRRLSIIDLSPLGHQPMFSHSGRYALIFNGEIYNFPELRQILEQHWGSAYFRGRSDTEVMLAAFEAWGVVPSLEHFVGMFAFALWDQQERALWLARDRMGEKPLYYGWQGATFLFGSELKALRAHPDWQGEINRDALTLYMRHAVVPSPYSIYQGVSKLPPATYLCLHEGNLSPEPIPYWSLKATVESGHQNPLQGSTQDLIDQLDSLLRQSVRQQMVADVPLGAFLSGGIDSSTIVALMQAQSSQPIKTFSIGFQEDGYNEAPFAKKIAQHLGTDHTELYVGPTQALDVIPRLPTIWDEPFADSSQIPTFLVSHLTRQHVTVSLSGDGGDELFVGYPRYSLMMQYIQRISRIQPWHKHIIRKLPKSVRFGLGRQLRQRRKFALADIVEGDDLTPYPYRRYHQTYLTHWPNPEALVLGATEPKVILNDPTKWANVDDILSQISYFDMALYLPDDILVKVDRAAMSVALETRVPLLDHRVVEFSQRLPMSLKMREGVGKWILRQVLYRYVPQHLVERPKMGFGVPIGDWLKNEMRDWGEALLNPARLRDEGYLNVEMVRQVWQEHQTQGRDLSSWLWDILMFQAWLDSLKN